MAIRLLPSDVIVKIKSSTAIISLNGVVTELLENSLDAGSNKVNISVDYSRGGCIVEDDGIGIIPSEFEEIGGLGKLHHTSKAPPSASLHGGHGIFLASVSAMSLLLITSRHQQYHSYNTLCMHKSEVVYRQVPAPTSHHFASGGHGTRVTVRDLFGSMPVRVKQRAANSKTQHGWTREWEELRRAVVLLILAWPHSVSLTLKGPEIDQKMLVRMQASRAEGVQDNFSRVCKVLSQASFVSSHGLHSWISVSASTSHLEVKGMISLQPCATKHVQFLSLGIHPLHGQSILHNDINRVFLNSAFGNEEEAEGVSTRKSSNKNPAHTMKELKGAKKGVDRWPMFYINIQQRSDCTLEADDILSGSRGFLPAISALLQAITREFLVENHFLPKSCRHSGLQSRNSLSSLSEEATSYYLGNAVREDSRHKRSKSPQVPGTFPSESRPSHKKRPQRSGSVGASGIRPQDGHASLQGSDLKTKSLFDEWSRIKSGAVSSKTREYRSKNPRFLPEASQPVSQTPQAAISSSHEVPGVLGEPLLSASHKIIRKPFEEVEEDVDRIRLWRSKEQFRVDSALSKSQEEDELITWVNPITKFKSSINERTGFAIAPSQLPLSTVEAQRLSAMSTRHLSSRKKTAESTVAGHQTHSSAWISEIVHRWQNPIFSPCEPSILNVANDNLEGPQHIFQSHGHRCSSTVLEAAFSKSAATVEGSISKAELRAADVISQVDKKFILLRIRTSCAEADTQRTASGSLVLVDQHAADERVRIEQLMSDFFMAPPPDAITRSGIVSTALEVPILFDVPAMECTLLQRYRLYFAKWGILYEFADQRLPGKGRAQNAWEIEQQVTVTYLPPSIMERCKLDPQLVIKLVRTEIWRLHEKPPSQPGAAQSEVEHNEEHGWVTRMHDCPRIILDMLNSRACRSSIMFNDEMNGEQCKTLIHRLSSCIFPFQCAHGRPSMVPLVDLEKMSHYWRTGHGEEENFGAGFKEWRNKLQ